MDHAGLVALGLDPAQQGPERLKLGLGGRLVTKGGVKVGVDAGDGDAAHVVVYIEDLVELLGRKAVAAHPRVQLQMGLGDGAPLLGDTVERHRILIGAHRGDDPEVEQLFQRRPV